MGAVVRLLTANLWNGGADPERFAELVGRLRADVVAVQELAPEQALALERVLPHGLLEPRCDHEGIGLALRHPAAVHRLALPGRSARVARLDGDAWGGLAAPLEVVNLHILPPHKWPPWRTLPARRAQVAAIADYLAEEPRAARAVAGDINATPAWPAYRRLTTRLEDAARLAARQGGPRPRATWGPWAQAPRLLRIDHVFVEGLRVERFEVVHVPGSDHSALLADLAPHPAAPAPAASQSSAP